MGRDDRHRLEERLLKIAVQIINSGYKLKRDGKEYDLAFTPQNIGIVYDELCRALHHPL